MAESTDGVHWTRRIMKLVVNVVIHRRWNQAMTITLNQTNLLPLGLGGRCGGGTGLTVTRVQGKYIAGMACKHRIVPGWDFPWAELCMAESQEPAALI